ncbi:MAG: hypothetical protein ABMA64_25150, partial [Myxococcota bacterium]
ERPALEVGPVVCAGPAPVVQLPFTFVFAPDPADPRLGSAQAASDAGCAVRLTAGPRGSLYLGGGVRGRVYGSLSVIDTTTLASLATLPLEDLQLEGKGHTGGPTLAKATLPPGTDLGALVVEIEGWVKLQCVGTGTRSWARADVQKFDVPTLGWGECGS